MHLERGPTLDYITQLLAERAVGGFMTPRDTRSNLAATFPGPFGNGNSDRILDHTPNWPSAAGHEDQRDAPWHSHPEPLFMRNFRMLVLGGIDTDLCK